MQKFLPLLLSLIMHVLAFSHMFYEGSSQSPNLLGYHAIPIEVIGEVESKPFSVKPKQITTCGSSRTLQKSKNSPDKIFAPLPHDEEYSPSHIMDGQPEKNNRMPPYPKKAKDQGIEASFIITLHVNEKGEVYHLETPLHTPSEFLKPVSQILRTWRFKRTQKKPLILNIPFEFKLDD